MDNPAINRIRELLSLGIPIPRGKIFTLLRMIDELTSENKELRDKLAELSPETEPREG